MGHKNSKQLARCIALLLSCVAPGCCQLETVANSVSHWGETRANCATPAACTPGCPEPCVSLQPPEGYLADGATFAGDQITGPPSKTAVDRMIELDDEVGALRNQNVGLQHKLELAQQTIQDQGRAIDTAGRELERAVRDYGDIRGRLDKWNSDLSALNGHVRQTFQHQQQLLNQFEDELEDVLAVVPVEPQGIPTAAPPPNSTLQRGIAVPPAPTPKRSVVPGAPIGGDNEAMLLDPLLDELIPFPPQAISPLNGLTPFGEDSQAAGGEVSLSPPRNQSEPSIEYVR